MPAMEPLCRLIGIKPAMLSKKENILLEAVLFVSICEELTEIFREKYRDYFHLMKFNIKKENDMLEAKAAQLIINDLALTDDYDWKGIALYTDTFEDIVEEIATGRNKNPSATFLKKLIGLHRSVRHELYEKIIKKIIDKYLLENKVDKTTK